MATDTLNLGDQYATEPQRRAIGRKMRELDMTTVELAILLRISKSHLYGMLSGRHKMPHVYVLAIKQVLLERHLERRSG